MCELHSLRTLRVVIQSICDGSSLNLVGKRTNTSEKTYISLSCIEIRKAAKTSKQTVFLFFNLYVSGKELFAVPIFVQQVFEMTLFRGLFSSEK